MFNFGNFEDLPEVQSMLHNVTVESNASYQSTSPAVENSTKFPALSSAAQPTPEEDQKSDTNSCASQPTSDKVKSWAGLFNGSPLSKSQVMNEPDTMSVPVPLPGAIVKVPHQNSSDPVDQLKVLGESLGSLCLDSTANPALPRGLFNKGTTCYMNAGLQALLHCPPMRALLNSMQKVIKKGYGDIMPAINYLLDFNSEFLDYSSDINRAGLNGLIKASAFQPDLKLVPLLGLSDGRQEDCEEFLTRLLTMLHEEMLVAITVSGDASSTSVPEVEDDDWTTVGKSGRPKMDSKTTEMPTTPISRLLCGYTMSVLKTRGEERRAALQPFFILPLDIQDTEVTSVEHALVQLSRSEMVDDYHSPNTGRATSLQRHTCLDSLPPLLILQLKRFVYTEKGSQKVLKMVTIDEELLIPSELLNSERRYTKEERSYSLQAVIFHHGKRCVTGHYTTAIRHPVNKEFLLLDDEKGLPLATVNMSGKRTANGNVVPRTPYLLFYRRKT